MYRHERHQQSSLPIMFTPPSTPPIIEDYKENSPVKEPFPYPVNAKLPSYVEQNPEYVIDRAYNFILDAHRCVFCSKYLCCGHVLGHSVNCWAENMRGNLSIHDLKMLWLYQFDALTGSMDDYVDYCFETFNESRHVKAIFTSPSIGFFVRCFQCKDCSVIDKRTCHCTYHNHEPF